MSKCGDEEAMVAFQMIEEYGLMIWPPRFNKGGVWAVRKEDQNQNTIARATDASLYVAVMEVVKQLT